MFSLSFLKTCQNLDSNACSIVYNDLITILILGEINWYLLYIHYRFYISVLEKEAKVKKGNLGFITSKEHALEVTKSFIKKYPDVDNVKDLIDLLVSKKELVHEKDVIFVWSKAHKFLKPVK